MCCRHDIVLIIIAFGLLMLAGVTILLALLGLLGDVFAFEVMAAMVFYTVPLALLLAVVARIVRHADRSIERRFKK